ncbi:aminodeoxychorismate synthase component I [Haloferula sargassicola]|uniref:Isochorismate synthase MenF n=1 Tax=Haloferula sargassicola TaxID=490096 RepID=A0ABP9UIS5_9BACT
MSSTEVQPRPDLDGMSPLEVAGQLRHLPGLVFLDSAGNLPADEASPASIIAAGPVEVLKGSIFDENDRARLEARIAARGGRPATDLGFPTGGLCGWIGYEGGFVFGDYPRMLVHTEAGGWADVGGLAGEMRTHPPLERPWIGPVEAQWTRRRFVDSVARIREWIAAGDIYQVNLAQGFAAEVRGASLFSLYERLRAVSPAPMAAWLSLDGTEVLSSSPETFLRISGRGIETRPIKGTRPRFAEPAADRRSAYELQTSPKEIAELVMITDLLRNDLGRICEFGSVEVEEMLRLETLAQVHHLVSVVRGRLREGVSAVSAVASCFPGGSITGAPKRRAMEIISELEQAPRGIYCGAIGCFGYHGESRFNIAIRTMVREGNRLHFHAGAGIVADSDPEKEFEETLHKAEGIRLALQDFSGRA